VAGGRPRWEGHHFGGARLPKDRIGLARILVHTFLIVGDICGRAEPWPQANHGSARISV
jgi:hypothetical protein